MYGSPTLMQTLMKHNLIDEYQICVHPLVIGEGTRLFTENGETAELRLVGAKTQSSVWSSSLTYAATRGPGF